MTDEIPWADRSRDYRRGYIEGRDYGERDALMLQACAQRLAEYEAGFRDGLATREESDGHV